MTVRGSTGFHSVEWGDCLVSNDDVALLAEFTGRSRDEALSELASYRPERMGEAWRRRDPVTAAQILAFYEDTDLYLWELLAWHGSAHYQPYLRRLDRMSSLWPPASYPRALDYGAGIGTAAIRLAELGYRVTLADVSGPTLEFARARLERRGLQTAVVAVGGDAPALKRGAWDVLVYYDVVEHLPDPEGTTKELVRALVTGGGGAIVAGFTDGEERYPHHLRAAETRLGGYRWETFLRGLGLRPLGDRLYVKTKPLTRAAQRARYASWRLWELRRRRR